MALAVDLEHRNSRNTADDKCTTIKRCVLCCSYRRPCSWAYNDGILLLINLLLIGLRRRKIRSH